MEVYAIHKSAIIAPRKARMTLDLVRGKDVKTAEGILLNTNTKASRLIIKVLKSAVANAVNNNSLKEETLVISECFINPGPVLKRVKMASRSHIDRRDKRTSHIIVKVADALVATKPVKETKEVKTETVKAGKVEKVAKAPKATTKAPAKKTVKEAK